MSNDVVVGEARTDKAVASGAAVGEAVVGELRVAMRLARVELPGS